MKKRQKSPKIRVIFNTNALLGDRMLKC